MLQYTEESLSKLPPGFMEDKAAIMTLKSVKAYEKFLVNFIKMYRLRQNLQGHFYLLMDWLY